MMLETKLDQKLIGFFTVFENITKARVKDAYLLGDMLLFVVQPGDAGKAIGKKGQNIFRLSKLMKKKIKVVEYHDDIGTFVKHYLEPLQADEVTVEGSVVTLKIRDMGVKGKVIGRNGKNLKVLQGLVEKYFSSKVVVA
jgi:transcription termination/antitermination protein NusA